MTTKSELIEKYEPDTIGTKAGDLYAIKSSDARFFIVLVSGIDDDGKYFSGTVINSDNSWPVGHYSSTWIREAFKPFYGEILITSE